MWCQFTVVLLLAVASIKAYGEICSIEGVDFLWGHRNSLEIKSDHDGEVEVLNFENITSAKFKDSKYLDVKIDKDAKLLRVSTSENFGKYEEEGTSLEIKDKLMLECFNGEDTDTYEVGYTQGIEKENKHAPVFGRTRYDYVLYGDLPRQFALTDLLPIEASDRDIYVQNFRFGMENSDDLYLNSYNGNKPKTGYAEFKTTDEIKAPINREFNLTVRDGYSGEVLSSTVPMTLRIERPDEEMQFENSEYSAQLIDGEKLVVNDEIRLANGLDHSTQITVRSDYKNYFSTSFDILSGAISLQLTEPLPIAIARKYDNVEVWLDAYWKGITASTKIAITPNKEIAKLCYVYGMDLDEGVYRARDIVEDHRGVIGEFDTLNVGKVECTGEKAKYFSCEMKETKLVIGVTKEFENYEDNEFERRVELDMDVHCPYDEVKKMKYIQIIEDINTHAPEFDREKYEYVLYGEIPNGLMITDILPITVRDNDIGSTSYNCKTVPEYHDYIYTEMGRVHEKNALCSVHTKQTMQPGFEMSFTVVASDAYYNGRESNTTISIKVIEDEEQLRFKRSKVNAVLKNNAIDVIELENGLDFDTEFNLRSEYADYFSVSTNILKEKIEIRAVKDLTEIKADVVRILLEAHWHGLNDTTEIYLYMNGELPPIIVRPSMTLIDNFDTWLITLNVIQIVAVSVVGVTLCSLGYIVWRYYY